MNNENNYRRILFTSLMIFLVPFIIFSQDVKTDTLQIFFFDNEIKLNTENQQKINNLLSSFKENFTYTFQIYSYSGIVAEPDNFEKNAQKRINNVKNYIHTKGISYNSFRKTKTILSDRNNLPSHIIGQQTGKIYVLIIIDFFQKKNPDFAGNAGKKKLLKDILENGLDAFKEGDNISIANFNFQGGRHFLTKRSKPQLSVLLEIMKKYPKLEIEIQGHICCQAIGEPDGYDIDTKEYRLSYNRAKYIYDYLEKNGIQKTRLSYYGFSGSRPLVREIDEETRAINRRVELKILAK